MFKGLSKLFICGRYYPSTDTCEVINLASSASTCKNPPNFPAKVSSAIGGLGFKGNPILCGGYQNDVLTNKCYTLENNDWGTLNSAEMLTENGWESNIPSLPVTIVGHCMVTVNSTTVMVIGGWRNDQIFGKTFYFNFGEES